jgi:hypothetical protein
MPANGILDIWVEWNNSKQFAPNESRQATLELVARKKGVFPEQVLDHDSVTFSPFQGVVIAMGGENDDPKDPPNPAQGLWQMAKELYTAFPPYDVHPLNEDFENEAFNEVRNAVRLRDVIDVAMFGFSHGGGSIYNVVRRLDRERVRVGSFDIKMTGYIDAIQDDSSFPEFRRPPGSVHHVNFYQYRSPIAIIPYWPYGGPTTGLQVGDVQVNVAQTPWGARLSHFSIDQHPNVKKAVVDAVRTSVTP